MHVRRGKLETYKFDKKNILYIVGMVISSSVALIFSYGISYFIDIIIMEKQLELLIIWTVSMIIICALGGITSIFLGQYIPILVQLKKSIEISQDVMAGIINSAQSIYQQNEKGYYINIVTSSSFSYGDMYGQLYIDLIGNMIYALIIIFAAGFINVYFAALFICYIPLCWIVIKNPSKRIAEFQKEGLPTQDKFLSETKKIVESKREINIAKADEYFHKRYKYNSLNFLDFVKKFRLREIISRNSPVILANFYQILILSFSAYLAYTNEITIGTIFLLYQFTNYFNVPIARVFEILIHRRINQPHIDRVETLLKDSKEESGFEKIYFNNHKYALNTNNFQLYPEPNKKKCLFVAEDIKIQNNSLVIVKGGNGCGKSMFLNYLTGFSNPKNSTGNIIVNSNFKDVAYLTYPLIVVNGSLEENMLGIDINESVKNILGIDFENKIIQDHPINLSYGQQQKLNLLRVLSSKTSVLILDEPLTNLDKGTQNNLIEYIKSIKGKTTIFVIMHSSELDEDADLILQINNEVLSVSNG